jgi:cell division protein ZapA (FtsZ GTPase activity inhibitor)
MGDSVGKPHEVVLLGKKYKLRSTHDDEYLAKLAEFVSAQVTEVQRRGTVSTLDAALLAALNIADEYHRLKGEAEERLAAIQARTEALLASLGEIESGKPGGGATPPEAEPDEARAADGGRR